MMRAEIVGAARGFIGVPWRRHGRTKHGLDCGGLIYAISGRLGFTFADLPVSERGWPDGFLLRHFARYGVERPCANPLALGAVAIFTDGGKARHAGVIGGLPDRWTLIHSNARARRVVEEPLSADWRGRLVTSFDFPTVNP